MKSIAKIAIAGVFAASTATAVVATEAANPAQIGAPSAGILASTSEPASAGQGYRYYRRGWYSYHGRYWEHRRWQAAYYGPGHFYHPGIWIYF